MLHERGAPPVLDWALGCLASHDAMNPDDREDDLRSEYDFVFSNGVRGKHFEDYMGSSNGVVVETDVAGAFQIPEAVNAAPRLMLKFVKQAESLTGGSAPSPEMHPTKA